jgi:hypothetical protein
MPYQRTSADAYQTANLPRREAEVLKALEQGPATDLELVARTGLAVNVICGARNRLIERGEVFDSGDRRLSPHGKRNIVWAVTTTATKLAPNDGLGPLDVLLGC